MPGDTWPDWARPQLLGAVALAERIDHTRPLATALYRGWFTPPIACDPVTLTRPLAGIYRRAHAGSARVIRTGGVRVVRRHDVVGRDRWWRTWNETWTRPAARTTRTRLQFSPRIDAVADVVQLLTAALLDRDEPWLLACPTDPARLRHSGAVVLTFLGDRPMPPVDLGRLLRDDTSPLCLPVARGVAVAQYPDNGMTFGEHRCHLVAIALSRGGAPLPRIAEVFTAHGIDPAAPHQSAAA